MSSISAPPVVRVLFDPLLAECPGGAVALCPCCGHPVVEYGDERVTVTAAQLRALLGTVREAAEAMARPGACWTWALRARTEREDATFHLTMEDAEALADLLAGAAAALDLDALLADVLASPFD